MQSWWRRSQKYPELAGLPQTLGSRLHFPALESVSLSGTLCLPAWMKLSLSPSLSLSLDSLKGFCFFLGAGSFRCHAQFLSSPRWKRKVPVCSWLVVRPLNLGLYEQRDRKRGRRREGGRGKGEVENFPPPPSLSAYPPSSSSCWPLSIVPAGTLRALSPNQSGFQWGQRSYVAFYGPQEEEEVMVVGGDQGRCWSGGFYSLSVKACVSTPTICSPRTETKACRHTLAASPAMCLILAHHKLHHKVLWLNCVGFTIVSVEACAACLFLTSVSQEMSWNGRRLCPSVTPVDRLKHLILHYTANLIEK